MKRRLFALGGSALAARLVVGCGTLLRDDPALSDVADVSDAGSGPALADGDVLEGSAPDAVGPGVPDVVSSCQTVIFDGFEDANWDQTYGDRWTRAASTSGIATRSQEPGAAHSGQAAVRFTASDSDGFVHLATQQVGGSCALTIDFWVMRKTEAVQDGSGVILFELTAPGRTRQLRQFGPFLHLDYETRPDGGNAVPSEEVSNAFASNAYHHVVVRYELSGTMTVTVDDADTYTLTWSGPDTSAAQIRFGILGSTGAPAPKELMFDDVLIY